ncbi:CinA family protein [Pedobacter polaris]|uniref:CinA family protein n=1 Tax=Pedobacter polaris TaxID=2571273 RepID=A0A4V5P1I8_9SPHI|nr:nicotinamide-nucleotide amidohydrolase family protein [Pedobacter polaris]TKC10522.1 CinA family protein [Pedobacter polaris]
METQPNLKKIQHCADELISQGLTIAFAESATAGRICADFSLADDAGKFLKGGLACYDANLKEDLLKVDPQLIETYTPESPQVTMAITKGLAQLIKADIHIGCTGLTCPGGSETIEKPVGTMFFYGILNGQTIFSEKTVFPGSPNEVVVQSVDRITQLLLDYLLKSSADESTDDGSNKNKAKSTASSGNGFDEWSVSWP